jgi:hypothetical protein
MARLYSNLTFKILLCVSVSLGSISGWTENDHRGPESQSNHRDGLYGDAVTLATIKDDSITESSGLVASRSSPGAYWTHNDSGDGPFVYAFNNSGVSLGVFRVTGAQARDWEDIDAGPGPQRGKSYLYIGDIGDNRRELSNVTVYRIREPVLPSNSTKRRPRATEPAVAIRLQYPDGSHDAETLLVHPASGAIYIVTKVAVAHAVVYEAAPPFDTGKVITLRRIGELAVPNVFGGLITGGSISPDGRRVVLCDYFQGYELALPAGATSFNEIWKQKMTGFQLGERRQGEAITYRLDGKAILATSEGKQSPLIQVERRQ